VTRAKAIDRLIVEKSGTININDTDDDDDDQSDSSDREQSRPAEVHTVVTRADRSETAQPRRTRGAQTTDLIHKIAHSLDPEAQRLRDEERSNCSLQNTQVLILSQQLRDANGIIDSVRSENTNLRDRLNKVERMRDRLDMELNWARSTSMSDRCGQDRPYEHRYNPDLIRVRGKIRNVEHFSDGGQQTTWITDGESTSDWCDSEKENRNPFPPSQYSPYPTRKPQRQRHSQQSPSKISPSRPFLVPQSAEPLASSSQLAAIPSIHASNSSTV